MNFKNVFRVSFFTFLSRIFGLIRDLLISRYLGASIYGDVFFIAFKLPNLFRRLFAEGAMQSAFIPIFNKLYNQDKKLALIFSHNILFYLMIILVPMVGLMMFFAQDILKIISPGLFSKGEEIINLAISLIRITLPYLLFISIAAFFSSILNSLGKFSLVALSPIILNIAMIIAILVGHWLQYEVYILSWGVFIGGLLQFCAVFIICYLLGWFQLKFLLKIKKSHHVSLFFKRIIPVALGAGTYQLNILIELIAASFLSEGAISYLFYVDRIYQLPLAMIGISIATVILPYLSSKGSAYNKLEEKNNAILLAVTLAMLAVSFTIVYANDIIRVIFLGGQFTLHDAYIAGIMLTIVILSLPFNILIKIILQIFYAQGNTKTPFIISLLALLLNFIAIFYFVRLYHIYGIVFANVVSSIFNFLLLYVYALKKNYIFININFIKELIKLIPVNMIFVMLLWLIKYILLADIWSLNMLYYRIVIFSLILIAVIIYLIILRLFKSLSYRILINMFSKQ